MPPRKDEPPDETTRKGRAKSIRRALDLTTEVMADRLNDAAEGIGLDRYWTAQKVTLVELGKRDISSDDALAYGHVDPERRGWLWVMKGLPLLKGEDAWTVLNKAAKRIKRA